MNFSIETAPNGLLTALSYKQQKVTEEIISGLNEGLNEGLKSLFELIAKNVGIQAKDLPNKLNDRPLKTIERQIKQLIEKGLIERKGSKKTGGYWVIDQKIVN